MKRVVIAFAGLALVTLASSTAHAYKSAGCGLGSMIFKDDDFSQVFAATTNVSLGTQVFGITSGTSGCREGGTTTAALQQEVFVASNFDNLSQDMARGSGEYVTAFASLMGCPAAEFSAWAQSQYSTLNNSSAQELLQSVRSGVNQDASLAKTCTQVNAS